MITATIAIRDRSVIYISYSVCGLVVSSPPLISDIKVWCTAVFFPSAVIDCSTSVPNYLLESCDIIYFFEIRHLIVTNEHLSHDFYFITLCIKPPRSAISQFKPRSVKVNGKGPQSTVLAKLLPHILTHLFTLLKIVLPGCLTCSVHSDSQVLT